MVRQPLFLRLHADDNVAVALKNIPAGTIIRLEDGTRFSCQEIPAGHKFCLENLLPNHKVVKFGQVIGATTQAVARGEHVHLHNLASLRKTVST